MYSQILDTSLASLSCDPEIIGFCGGNSYEFLLRKLAMVKYADIAAEPSLIYIYIHYRKQWCYVDSG